MDVLEFFGFIILMIASVALSFKTSKEKKESIRRFEEEEREEEGAKEIVKPMPRAVKPPEPPKNFLKKDAIFDMHKGAFAKKEAARPNPITKLKSIQEAIVIQEILNKPKGW